jgi:hypothetical protein
MASSTIYSSMRKNQTTLAGPSGDYGSLIELANLEGSPEAIERFQAKYPDYADVDVLSLQDKLQYLWQGGRHAGEVAGELLFTRLKIGIKNIGEGIFPSEELPIGVDWKGGELTYKPLNEFQAALYALLKHSRLAEVCARPGCAAPYFVAGRITQQYCSVDCADAMQDEWRRNWWNAHGNEWRRKRKKQSKRRKRA